MRTFVAGLIVGLSITSAFAEGSPIASTWLDQVTRSGTDAPEPYGSVKQVNQVTIGSHAVVLEETSMDEIAQALGGSVQHWGEAGEAVSWACFSRMPKRSGSIPMARWARARSPALPSTCATGRRILRLAATGRLTSQWIWAS